MALDNLQVELTVVLGRASVPLHRLMRMGRGAVIALDAAAEDIVEILANGLPIARGRVSVAGQTISVEVTELVRNPGVSRAPGLTIGGRPRPDRARAEVETHSEAA